MKTLDRNIDLIEEILIKCKKMFGNVTIEEALKQIDRIKNL